jgi:hypothetical protein
MASGQGSILLANVLCTLSLYEISFRLHLTRYPLEYTTNT